VDCLQAKKHKQDSREVNLYAAEKWTLDSPGVSGGLLLVLLSVSRKVRKRTEVLL
jgi:hypothetical protein